MNYEAFLAIVGQSTIQKLDDAAATRFGGQVGDSDIVPKKCTYKASSDMAALEAVFGLNHHIPAHTHIYIYMVPPQRWHVSSRSCLVVAVGSWAPIPCAQVCMDLPHRLPGECPGAGYRDPRAPRHIAWSTAHEPRNSSRATAWNSSRATTWRGIVCAARCSYDSAGALGALATTWHARRRVRWMQMREKKSLGVEQLHTCDMHLNVYV